MSNVNDLESTPTITLSQGQSIPPKRSQEAISHNSESTSQSYILPADVKRLNERFFQAVKDLDTPLICAWIKDPLRRTNLNSEHIRSALLDLTSMKGSHIRFRVQAVKVILDECVVDLECVHDVYKATPLILAAIFGEDGESKATTELLIDKGAMLLAEDEKYHRTALSWAARNNKIGTATVLLEAMDKTQYRQIVKSEDIYGCTAHGLAHERGHKDIERLIESRGAILNA
jgi:ankyrin repeat protein